MFAGCLAGVQLTELVQTAQATALPAIRMRELIRRVVGATALYGLANFGTRALNFLLLPLYTRYLAPSDYGLITLSEAVAAFLALVIGLGFDGAIERLYFQHVDLPAVLASYLGSALKFSLVAAALAVLLTLTLGAPMLHAFAPAFEVPYRFLAWAILTAASGLFLQDLLVVFQCQGRPRSYVLLSTASFLLTAGFSVALVVFAHGGASGMLRGKLVAALILLVITLFLFAGVLRSRFRWRYVRETLAIGTPLVPHQLMAGGLIAADRFILGHYRDLREVGLYSIAYTFGGVMALATMSLTQAWAPVYYQLAGKREEGRRAMGRICSELAILLSAIACFGALIAQDFIAHFLDHRYLAAGKVIPWIIGAYLAHSMFTMFTLAAMQAKQTRWLMLASFLALVANTVLNFALIPHWGMYGAAYATVAAYVIEAFSMYYIAQHLYPLRYDLPRILAASAAFLIVLAGTQASWTEKHRMLAMSLAAVFSFGLLAGLGLKHASSLLSARRDVT
jgi:O-antigen/teichoic acid export membrane protein